jgi:hypothetical protein
MQANGNTTNQEFSATAELLLITVSSLSDTIQPPGPSKTPGEPDGEKKDTSSLKLETPAVLPTQPHTLLQPNDHH